MIKIKELPSLELLNTLFDYNPETGEFIRKIAVGSRGLKGSVAGSINGIGYLRIRIKSFEYLGHRLAYYMFYKNIPDCIDHIDRNPSNNAILNLRPATQLQNSQNSSVRKDNTSGFKGVRFNKQSCKWFAQIFLNKKQTYLGCRNTPEEAYKLYKAAAVQHFGEFACV